MESKQLENKIYTIFKLGNRNEAESYNQTSDYAFHGLIGNDELKIELDDAVYLGSFNTSRIRSIFEYHDGDTLEEIIESLPRADDVGIPKDMKNGDLILGTMNSVYLLTEFDPNIDMDLGPYSQDRYLSGYMNWFNELDVSERKEAMLEKFKDRLCA